MSTELEIPDYLKGMMETFTGPKTKNMQSGGSTTPRISLKGKIFRFKEGGEEIEKVKEDLDVVIVGVMPEYGTTKTFYAGQYSPDSSDPPDCSSMNGQTPDTWVSKPVSDSCVTCVNNKFGSAISMSGKKSKACRDSRRLYVVRAKELKDEEPKVWLLNATIMSLKPLSLYSQLLLRKGIPTPAAVITRINFNEDAEFPQLTFDTLGFINQDMAKISFKLAEDKSWDGAQSMVSKAIGDDKQSLPAIEDKSEDNPKETKSEDEPKQATMDAEDILNSW